MLEQLKQMNEELEALKKVHHEKCKVIFADISKFIFDKHPKLKSFGWNQYTPYFNDGDECTFRVNSDVNINGINLDDCEDDENFYNEVIVEYGEYDRNSRTYPNKKEFPNTYYDQDLVRAKEDCEQFISNLNEDVLKQMFGDHVEVIVTRDGVDTEEYSHD